jgi:uncharacterized protein (DUF58 family)
MLRPMPTLRGWTAAACGVALLLAAAHLDRVDLLFAGLLLTLAPLGAMIAVAFDRPWLDVSRSYAPDSAAADEPVQVRLEVRNLAARPTPALGWADTLPRELAPALPRGGRAFPSLAPAGTRLPGAADRVVLRYTARARRRGAYLLGPLRVTRTDPFGLARGGYLAGESKMLLVTPRVAPLSRGAADEARGEGSEPELVRHSIPSLDEVIPREYRPGDPLRRVQWRATARLDRLMVRQEEQLSNPQAWLLLDTAQRAGGSGDAPAFERAVELVASVVVHLLGLGYLVGVHETARRQLVGGYELPGGDHLLIGELAALEQTGERDGDFAERFQAALRTGRSGAPTFLVLVDGDPAGWRELAALRRFAEPACAFLMTPAALEARDALEAAGWVCVVPEQATDARAAWSAATAAHRARAGLSGSGRV